VKILSGIFKKKGIRDKADAQLQSFANILTWKLEKQGKKEGQVSFEAGDLARFLEKGGNIETLAGYEQLHRVCEKFDKKLEVKTTGPGGESLFDAINRSFDETVSSRVVVMLNRPYRASSKADFLPFMDFMRGKTSTTPQKTQALTM